MHYQRMRSVGVLSSSFWCLFCLPAVLSTGRASPRSAQEQEDTPVVRSTGRATESTYLADMSR
eukprot:12935326-Prorocentrum_lima.AAC.1